MLSEESASRRYPGAIPSLEIVQRFNTRLASRLTGQQPTGHDFEFSVDTPVAGDTPVLVCSDLSSDQVFHVQPTLSSTGRFSRKAALAARRNVFI